MEHGNSQTIASFTGKLLKREQFADNKLVRLIFREGDKNWLCVSTNPADATWPVGELYKIEGEFKRHGKLPYIYKPTIATLKQGRTLTFNKVLVASVGVAVLAITIGVYALLKPSNGGQALGASTSHPNQTVATKDTTDAAAQQAAPAQDSSTPSPTTPASSANTSTPKPATTPSPSPAPSVSTPVTPPVPTTPVVTPPAPDCDVAVIPFGHSTVVDDSQPVGTVVQSGVNGEQQTCYPDGRSAAGVTTVTKAPVDEISTVQSTPTP